MIDLIIFSVKESIYAISLEKIKRIIQVPELTQIANSHPLIEGMMSYENEIIKVAGFRQMLEFPTYASDLAVLFESLKEQHSEWIEALKNTVEKGAPFTKATNPHMCGLGKWLDAFTSYDDSISHILADLNKYHKRLHGSALDIMQLLEEEKQDEAQHYFDTTINDIYNHTIAYLDSFITQFELVANSLQKLLLYHDESVTFAIKVDSIEDILHVEEEVISQSQDQHKVNQFLELEGVVEIDKRLINVIKSVTLPTKEVA